MSLPNEVISALLSGDSGYQIERSLRFNSADSAYLNRTPSTAGNRRTFTWSGWVKRSKLGLDGCRLFVAEASGSDIFLIRIQTADVLNVVYFNGTNYGFLTLPVYRDVSSWYHVLVSIDTTQATASDRFRLYINGERVTALTNLGDIPQNTQLPVNNTVTHAIGNGGGNYYDGYLADVHFIDGSALDPTYFGETNPVTGVWDPIEYTGSYGTNGFHLDFSDNSAATAAALGADSSGNSNNWTPNNLSVTAGVGNDSLVDVPTNGTETDTGVGGEVRGNYATWNPLTTTHTLSNGNLYTEVTGGGGSNIPISATIALSASGKWYWEITAGGSAGGGNGGWDWGIVATSVPNFRLNNLVIVGTGGCYGVNGNDGNLRSNNTTAVSSYVSGGITGGDVAMVAYDASNGNLWLGKNGTWGNNGGTGNPASGTNAGITGLSGEFMPVFEYASDSGLVSATANYGQRPFAYTAPSGFKALCTTNLTAPTIVKPSTVFDTKLYTGNGSTQTISGLNFSPDFVWLKARSAVDRNIVTDIVRGVTNTLNTDDTRSEASATEANQVTAYTSTGFTVGSNGNVNGSSVSFVAWTWDAGTSTVSNTAGSITSQVRANVSAGFSIVSYTGNNTNGATIGHGLGKSPSMIIVKERNGASGWFVYHKSVGATKYLTLNATTSATTETGAGSWFFGTEPTSSVFTVGANGATNENGMPIISYCWAEIPGFSKFGSYTGNGSTDGPFVFCGFRPKFVMFKCSSSSESGNADWHIQDSSRNASNISTGSNRLFANLSNAESSNAEYKTDFLSNGFKLRTDGVNYGQNNNGNTYIFAAFAESPFNYSRAR
jgi:hypothetical protein